MSALAAACHDGDHDQCDGMVEVGPMLTGCWCDCHEETS